MWKTLLAVMRTLTPAERRAGLLLLAAMMAAAAFEVAGIVSVTPFLFVLGDPATIETNKYLRLAFQKFNFADRNDFVLALAFVALVFLVGASMLRITVHYAESRYVNMRRSSIASRLLRSYLRQPYSYFLLRNSSDMAKTVLSEVDEFISYALAPALRLLSYGFVAIGVVAILFAIDPLLAIAIAGSMAGAYYAIYRAVGRLLARTGEERQEANRQRFKAVAEIFGGIKELKVLGREDAFLDAFQRPSRRFSLHQATHEAVAEIPKYVIEGIGFVAILAVSMYFFAKEGAIGQALPAIGLYGLAGFRLLPAAQRIYSSVARLRVAGPATRSVLKDHGAASSIETAPFTPAEPLRLLREIRLEDVSFQYPGTTGAVLQRLELVVPVRSTTAIIGATGAGKSTLTDLILGLQTPTSGRITIDGAVLDDSNRRAWQRNIGYVPQNLFILDDTVARNIAFGIDEHLIDQRRVQAAARLAQIHDFISESLAFGYQTLVGDRGARLSGGQRQRIGIARALYHDPDVLIFDEATNALDGRTEAEVLAAIKDLSREKTILMITHRAASPEIFDRVVTLEGGGAATWKNFVPVC